MKFFTKERAFVLVTILAFLALKLTSLHFRFSDEDVYFYMAEAVRRGLQPYRDFSLADPPFFVYLLAGLKSLIGSHLILLKAVPAIFDSGTAVVLYLILKKQGSRLAWLAPVVYLFSFTVLATSDFVTGAEVAVFFMALGLYLGERRLSFWAGTSFALACLAKLYIAPVLIGVMLYKIWQREWSQLGRLILGGLAATAVILLPALIASPRALAYYTILHQFHRPAGLDKWHVFSFFIQKEWLIIAAGFIGALVARARAFVLPLLLSLIFFLWFKDLYYLYLHVLMPLLVVGALLGLDGLAKESLEAMSAAAVLYLIFFSLALYPYLTSFRNGSIFEDHRAIALAIKNLPKDYPIYGVQEITPLLALESGRPIFENVIDSNTQNFAAGTLDKAGISERAVEHGIYLVTWGEHEGYFTNEAFAACREALRNGDIAVYDCKR